MRRITFQSRKRGPKTGTDEKPVEYGALRLPKELLEELKLYRSAYETVKAPLDENGVPEPMKVSFEQMITRWMNNVGRFDRDVQDEYLRMRAIVDGNREANARLRAEMGLPPGAPGPYYVDPAQGDVWEMSYEVYDDDTLSVPAAVGDDGRFWADFDGLRVPLSEVVAHEGWYLVNDAAVRIEGEDIARVEEVIIRHRGIVPAVKEEPVRTRSWYVHADGRHFEVHAGRHGKEDFAIDALAHYHYVSQTMMLAARFIRVEVPEA